jgi:putative ABC transport system substrate-binding protein
LSIDAGLAVWGKRLQLLKEAAPQVSRVAALHRLPDIHGYREAAEDGALMSHGFGIDMAAVYRQAATFIDRILRGALPGELPIQQPTQFSLAINLKTASALGLAIPPSLLVRADKIIA